MIKEGIMKKILKYQLYDFKYTILVYYAVFLLLVICGAIFNISYRNEEMFANTNGIEFSSVIVCFVCGICIFREHYWLSAQNSISRKTYVKGSFCTMLFISAILAISSQILIFLMKSIVNSNGKYYTLISLTYERVQYSSFFHIITNTLFTFTLITLFFFIGFLIAALFDRANKVVKIIIAAGIPIAVFIILPFLFSFFTSVREKALSFFRFIIGIDSQNPYMGIAVFVLLSAFVAMIIYSVVKKSEIS